MQALMLPLGEGDCKKGIRTSFLSAVAPMLSEVGIGIGYELKGNELEPDGWVNELRAAQPEAQLCWHPGAGIAKTLGKPEEPIPPALEKAATQAGLLKDKIGLSVFTIHLAPALSEERTGDDRFLSPIGAEAMLAHIKRQVEPLCRLAEATQGILAVETVDAYNFVDSGHKLPTYLALQTGAGLELRYLAHEVEKRTGIRLLITVDPEHVICSNNVFARQRDMATFPAWMPAIATGDQEELADITGYWLGEGQIPSALNENDRYYGDMAVYRAINDFDPALLHLGAAVEAETEQHEIGTHLPYNPWDEKQMALLDWLLKWSLGRETCRGWVIEVVGRRLSDRYSTWSPRPDDDEVAKLMSYLVVADHLKTLATA